jgi:hypothetical protein
MVQFKKSEDLEIYEMDYKSNAHLQTICELRQPVLFDYSKINPAIFETAPPDAIANVNVREVGDVDSITLPYSSAITLMKTDTKSRFFSEKNPDLATNWVGADNDLKPHMVVNSRRDIMFGSSGAVTPMRYHTEYRNFIFVKSGKIQVKMTPWKSRKYLDPISDYEHYEFRSTAEATDSSIKFLEFDVNQGYILYVPPYWFYSIKYESDDTVLYDIHYNSFMNCVANLPKWCMYYMQQQNLKLKVLKTKVSFDENVEKQNETIM